MELHPSLRMAGASTGKKLLAQGTAAMQSAVRIGIWFFQANTQFETFFEIYKII